MNVQKAALDTAKRLLSQTRLPELNAMTNIVFSSGTRRSSNFCETIPNGIIIQTLEPFNSVTAHFHMTYGSVDHESGHT